MELKEKIINYASEIKGYLKEYIVDIKSINKRNIKSLVIKRKMSLVVVTLFIFMGCGYFVGNISTSYSQLNKRLEVSLKNSNERSLRSIVRINDKKVEKGKLTPLIDYYKGDASKVELLMKELKGDGKSPHMEIKSEDGLLGEDYYVNLKVYNLRVDSNYKEGVIYINETEQILPGETLRGLVPGMYTIKGVLKGEYGEIVEEEKVLVERDAIESIDFKAHDITVESSFRDAEVYVNNEKSGLKVEEFKGIGPMPQDGSISIHIEKEFPWGIIKSEEHKVNDISTIKVELDIENKELAEDVTVVVNEFYESAFSALNEEDKSLITNATTGAVNKIYGVMEKKYFLLKNKYVVENVALKEENSVYSFSGGKYRATIVADVDYEVSKALFGFSKEKKNQKFFTKMLYVDGKWIVEDVENFSL